MTLGSRVMAFLLFPLSALGMTVTILSGHLIGGKWIEAAYALGRVSTILRILNYFKEFNENPFPGRITRQYSEKTRFFLISVNRP